MFLNYFLEAHQLIYHKRKSYLAKKMGLPIDKLIVATNQNDILHRAISKGSYEAEKVSETISPSMDIQIASNFERLIFDLNNGDDQQTSLDMKNIKERGQYLINDDKLNKISENFLSARMSEYETLEVIKNVYEKFAVVLDPHTKEPYKKLVENYKIEPQYCIFFEDIARNLKPAYELGMKTVWIKNDEPWAAKYSDSNFINYRTDNLAKFLKEINELR